jgi:flagellar biosynthesis/type III secretory pathway chaperone
MSQTPLLQDIAELLEREHHALGARDLEALESIQAERLALLERLGPAAADERPAFATVEFLRERNERLAEDTLGRLGTSLGRLGRGQRALAGYRTSVSTNVFSRALDREV